VDHILSVGKGYRPPDLVSVRDGGVAGGGYVRKMAVADLKAMAKAAEANGTPLVAWSPFRGYRQQRRLFNDYASGYGYDEATTFSARPGHSEHQLGLAIDFVAVGDTGLTSNWEVTRTGRWMARHAWQYGWVMSYPKGKSDVTCFSYEPWHYRYVGREVAAEIHASGLTIREYLWANYTMVDPTTGEPIASASVAPSTAASPSAAPGASPTVAPSTGASAPSASAPAGSPGATSPPTSGVGVGFWVEVPVVVAGLVLLLAVGVIAALRFARRARTRSR